MESKIGLRSANLGLKSWHSKVHEPPSFSWVTDLKICKHHTIRNSTNENLPHYLEDCLLTRNTQQRHRWRNKMATKQIEHDTQNQIDRREHGTQTDEASNHGHQT